jgi:prepilin-type N-terminal cleavage/methylation domain-containing protein
MTKNGFTLIELIVVVGLIGLLSTLMFPTLAGSLQKQDVRVARDAVASLHAKAKANAVRRGLSTTLHLAGGAIYITSTHPVTGALDTLSGGVQDLDLRWGVGLRTTRDDLVFDSRGLGTETSATTIVVSKSGFADTLTVSRIGSVVK